MHVQPKWVVGHLKHIGDNHWSSPVARQAVLVRHRFLLRDTHHISLLHCRCPASEAVSFGADAPIVQEDSPIHVAHKPKRRKSLQNVFLDDRGFPDQSHDYNTLLHSVDGGPILRKLKHQQPDLDAPIDPSYHSPFVANKHEAQMHAAMDLSHLSPTLQGKLY